MSGFFLFRKRGERALHTLLRPTAVLHGQACPPGLRARLCPVQLSLAFCAFVSVHAVLPAGPHAQIRSADEPATLFFRCTKCACNWREG